MNLLFTLLAFLAAAVFGAAISMGLAPYVQNRAHKRRLKRHIGPSGLALTNSGTASTQDALTRKLGGSFTPYCPGDKDEPVEICENTMVAWIPGTKNLVPAGSFPGAVIIGIANDGNRNKHGGLDKCVIGVRPLCCPNTGLLCMAEDSEPIAPGMKVYLGEGGFVTGTPADPTAAICIGLALESGLPGKCLEIMPFGGAGNTPPSEPPVKETIDKALYDGNNQVIPIPATLQGKPFAVFLGGRFMADAASDANGNGDYEIQGTDILIKNSPVWDAKNDWPLCLVEIS